MVRAAAIAGWICAAAILFGGCDKSADGGVDRPDTTGNGGGIKPDIVGFWVFGGAASMTMEFRADSSLSILRGIRNYWGTWSQSGDTITTISKERMTDWDTTIYKVSVNGKDGTFIHEGTIYHGTNHGISPVIKNLPVAWNVHSLHKKGTVISTPVGENPDTVTLDTLQTMADGSYTMSFLVGGQFNAEQGDQSLWGSWSVSGPTFSTLTVRFSDDINTNPPTDTLVMEVILDGKEGTFVEIDKKTFQDSTGMVTQDLVKTYKANKLY